MSQINQNNQNDTEILSKLRDYMHFMKGYGQLAIDLARHTKSSTRSVYRWIKGKSTPGKNKIQLIKVWLDNQDSRI